MTVAVEKERETFDVVVVGAGAAGLYMLHKLRGLGMRAVVIEAGDNVGGTWYWNRYPGARCDVTSVEYSFSFDKELEQEWNWSELMASQPEIERYMNHVADRFDLRRDIRFETRVTSATWAEGSRRWLVTTDRGENLVAPQVVMATGCLSSPLKPDIDGMDAFNGTSIQTSLWPKEGIDLTGKRVALIGTGSSGVQSTPEIAKIAGHLTVFQRTPTYTWPSMNRPLTEEDLAKVKANYETLRETQRKSRVGIAGSFNGALIEPPTAKLLPLSPEERQEVLDKYGFGATRMFADIATDMEANILAREMYAQVVRKMVHDPETARKLTPIDYPIGCKRGVVDQDYFESFNRENVTLVDLRDEPFVAVNETGIKTTKSQYDFDVIVYATGFDAMTGALNKIDIRGRGGEKLKEKWADGPRNYLGLMATGFPNLFTITGPGSPSVLSNMLVSIEQHVDWITDCLAFMRADGDETIEPSLEAEDRWVDHVNQVAEGTMYVAPSCNSWYLGANVPGKVRQFMPYIGGVGAYRQKCDEVAAKGYEGFVLGKAREAAGAR